MEEMKTKKVGRITLGITFIIVGISIILQLFLKQEVISYILSMWPVILIALGVEILYYSNKKNVEVKYDVLGFVLIFIVIMCGSIFSLVHLGIYRVTDGTFLSEQVSSPKISDYFDVDEGLSIINVSDQKIEPVTKENMELEEIRCVIESNIQEEDLNKYKAIFHGYSLYEFIRVNYTDHNVIEIYDLPDWCNDLQITIYTPDKDLVTYSNTIN